MLRDRLATFTIFLPVLANKKAKGRFYPVTGSIQVLHIFLCLGRLHIFDFYPLLVASSLSMVVLFALPSF